MKIHWKFKCVFLNLLVQFLKIIAYRTISPFGVQAFKRNLANILHRLIKTEEIKDKKASDLVVLNVKNATNQLQLKDNEVGEEILFNTALYKSAFSTDFLGN